MKNAVKAILRLIVKIAFRVQTDGLEKISEHLAQNPKNIFVCNHHSFLDGLMLGLFLPCDPVFLVHTTVVKNPLFKFLLKFADHLAIDPLSPMSLKSLAAAINQGKPVVIFPEGRITVTGGLMKIYEGTAFIAAKTKAAIIPITIKGLLKSETSRMDSAYPKSLFPKTAIFAHEPEFILSNPDSSSKAQRKEAGEKLRKLMQFVVFESEFVEQTLYEAYSDAMDYFGKGRTVIEDLDRTRITYGKLNFMIHAIGLMSAFATGNRKNVGVLLPNAPACAATVLGLSAYGRIPAMLNYTMSKQAFSACLKAAEISQIVSSKAFVEKGGLSHLVEIAEELGIRMVWLEEIKAEIDFGDKVAIFAHAMRRYRKKYVSPNSPAVVLFTSGSEGTPKGVALSHKAILSNVAQIKSVFDISHNDKVCNVLPMFHSFGLTAGTLLPMLSGASLLLYVSPLHYKVIPELIYDRNCTVMFGTNTFLLNYAKNANNYDFYKIRYAIAGAEKVSEQTRNVWFEKFGIRILEGYGATECAPVISVNTPMSNKFGSVGQFLPAIEYKLEPVQGIDDGGRLLVKGPNLMSGYLRENEPGKIQPVGEWYDTGDVVSISDEGFVSIKGRAKRFAKIGGEMVSLEAVDKIVETCTDKPFATEISADPNKGERIVLFSTDPSLDKQKIKSKIAELGQSNLSMPSEIRLIETIPLLGSGKIDYAALKSKLSAPCESAQG